MKALEWSQAFSHYNSMGAICCHGNQSSNPIWPKTYCSFSPTPVMLQIKFDRNWPSGLRDIHVWNCLRTHGRTDGRTPDRPVYYKLTLCAFGSGELKKIIRAFQSYCPFSKIWRLKLSIYYISKWDIPLKLHTRIPHGKTADTYFLGQIISPYGPLKNCKKIESAISRISFKLETWNLCQLIGDDE